MKMNKTARPYFLCLLLWCLAEAGFGQSYTVSNDAYWATYNTSTKKIRLVNKGYSTDTVDFTGTFYVMINSSPSTPARTKISENISHHITSWGGDADLYNAGAARVRSVQSVTQEDNVLNFTYTENTEFALTATFEMPDGDEYPELSFCLAPKKSSAFSVGYMGAPAYAADDLDELWQPLVWTEHKFPAQSYLTSSYHCTLPATMATYQGTTYGVIADPEMYLFELLPTFPRSEFGVALHNNDDEAQPMVWAPIMGRTASVMEDGDTYCFTIRLFTGQQSVQDFYEKLSLGLYGFADYDRHNVVGSLNTTLDRMIDYGMSEYSRFNEEAKGPSYETDIEGAVKVTSSLNPLNVAYVVDDEDIFLDRCLPMLEFLISRSNTTYADEETSDTGQTAYNTLGDAAMNFSEMMALYDIFHGNMPFLLEVAEEKSINLSDQAHERQWRQYIAQYRATGEEQYKTLAMAGADQYIADRIDALETDFNYEHHSVSSFWVQLAPKFVDLMELYEISGEEKYLTAAHTAARRFAMYTWMSPKVPDENITVNEGGVAPVYPSSGGDPMSVPEESVPAWRLSNFGMHAEAAATVLSHRSIFMAHHAPYFLKIGVLTGDDYLVKIAKSAMIGRYRNFPGYHMNTDRTTVHELEDFPLRSHDEISCTSMHYNHIWPMMSLLLDYLVSDATTRSDEQISFPAEFVEAFANLQSKIYGHKPGTFYDVDSVTLWMPEALLTIDQEELNYISARKGDTLLVAFTNQSDAAVTASVTINTDRVGDLESSTTHEMTVIQDNGTHTTSSVTGNTFSVTVSGGGITGVIIKGVTIEPAFQDKLYAELDSTWTDDYLEDDFADTHAMYLTFGEDLSEVYIFSASEKGTYSAVTLTYVIDGDTTEVTDTAYPFEFEVPVTAGVASFSFTLTTVDADGNVSVSDVMTLSQYPEATATLSGTGYVLAGGTAQLGVALTGTAPWTLVYSDGTNTNTVSDVQTSPYILTVAPSATSTYALESVTDAYQAAMVSGTGTVYVPEASEEPTLDGMLRQQQADGVFTQNYAQIKESSAYAREAVFTFSLAAFTEAVDQAAFSFYVYSADDDFSTTLQLHGIDEAFDSDLTWDTKPEDSAYTLLGERSYTDAWVPGYVSWDITDYVNQCMNDGTEAFSLRVTSTGSDVLLAVYTSEKDGYEPQLLYTGGGATTQTTTVVTQTTRQADNAAAEVTAEEEALLYIYPNPTDDELIIQSAATIQYLTVTNLQGKTVFQKSLRKKKYTLKTAGFAAGTYLLNVMVDNKMVTQKVMIR